MVTKIIDPLKKTRKQARTYLNTLHRAAKRPRTARKREPLQDIYEALDDVWSAFYCVEDCLHAELSTNLDALAIKINELEKLLRMADIR